METIDRIQCQSLTVLVIIISSWLSFMFSLIRLFMLEVLTIKHFLSTDLKLLSTTKQMKTLAKVQNDRIFYYYHYL